MVLVQTWIAEANKPCDQSTIDATADLPLLAALYLASRDFAGID